MTPTPRALAATTAAALALAALAGCSSSRAAGEPVTPDPATVQAQREAAKAAAYKGSEEAVRAYVAAFNKDRSAATGWYAAPRLIAENQAFLDELKSRGLTVKGSSVIESIEPIDYVHPNLTVLQVCSTVTGGVYDSKGRNVTSTKDGRPSTDKPRRLQSWYRTHRDSASRWPVEHVEQKGPC